MTNSSNYEFEALTGDELIAARAAVQEGLDDIAAGRFVDVDAGDGLTRLFDDIIRRGNLRDRDPSR